MKQLLLFACLSLFSLGLSAQTVFVDIDATGAGDGTSWADAYTNLNDALLDAAAGSEVWIADGTYVTPDTASFLVDKTLTILGGFNGTETEASAADPATNVTILSGDVMGDDVQGAYDSLSRVDNQRVLLIQDTTTVDPPAVLVTINGLTIQDGNVEGFVDGSFVPFAGAGLYALEECVVTNCIFRANHADFGAALSAFGGDADNCVFDNITVEDNYAGGGATIRIQQAADLTFRNSSFSAGVGPAATGMFVNVLTTGVVIEDSSFEDINSGDWGAAMEGIAFDDLTFTNVTFNRISGAIGGALALYASGGVLDVDGNTKGADVTMTGCEFKNIASTSFGGVIFGATINLDATDVTFDSIAAHQSGGGFGGIIQFQRFGDENFAIPVSANLSKIDISNVTGNAAGGMNFLLGASDQLNLSDVTIDNVEVTAGGAGMWIAGPGGAAATPDNVVTIDNLNISNVVAGGAGGGMRIDDIEVLIENSTFERSVATNGSGIIFVFDVNATINNCTFNENGGSNENAFRGGGIGAVMTAASTLTVNDSRFTNNVLVQESGIVSGGGGIYASNFDDTPHTLNVNNCLFEANTASGDASGGAIRIDDGTNANVDNCRFFFNNGSQGGALFSFLFEIPDTVNNIPLVSLPEFNFNVTNSIFNNNSAGSQGGAVCTQRSMMSFTNTAFTFNSVSEEGSGGGAIIFNGISPNLDGNNDFLNASEAALTSEIVNCTFLGNRHSQSETGVGNSIALFQTQNPFDDTEQSLSMTLQNNVFFSSNLNDVEELAIELEPTTADPNTAFGPVNITSNGGNFFNVGNGDNVDLGMVMTDVTDLDLDDPEAIFEDPLENESDFPLVRPLFDVDNPDANPLVGTAVTGGLLPATGLEGNPRGDFPEIGAYELEWSLTDVQDIEQSGLDLTFFPNPTADVLNIESRNASIQSYSVILTDANGRVLRSNRFNGTVNQINFTTLPAGVYNLQLEIDGAVYSKQIVRQ